MMMIPTAAIDIVSGLREDSDDERDQMAISMKTMGLLQPIVACPNPEVPGRYICIAGRRRLLTARRLGWDGIECTVRDGDEVDRELVELVENLHRKELSPLERARSFRRIVDLWAGANPDAAAAMRARAGSKGNLKVVDAVARHMGVSRRTVRRLVAADHAAEAFTPEQRAVVDHSGLSAQRAAAIASIEDPDLREQVVTLIGANMNYGAAMREVLGDAFEGDPEEDAELSDEEFLEACPIRPRVNRVRFDGDALLYRPIAEARRQLARAIGWSRIKSEVGQGQRGVYFARVARFLEAPHPKDWLQCHDCAQGKTQHGDCRKCGGGGYLIG